MSVKETFFLNVEESKEEVDNRGPELPQTPLEGIWR